MGLNRDVATRLAEERLSEWRRLDYAQWSTFVDDTELREVIEEDARRYSVKSTGMDDGDGRVRISVAVDDGGWSSFAPLVRDEVMCPDGSLLP